MIDLTHELTKSFPTPAGQAGLVIIPWASLDVNSARSEVLFHDTHTGTHIDAPAYLLKQGKTIDQFGPEVFVKDAVLLDLTHMKPRQLIDDEDLEAAEERAGLAVREGEIAIIQTGWDRFVHREDYLSNHPGLSMNGAEYLEFKHVTGVGVDAPNLDHPESKNFPAHAILLRKEIFILESLCGLDKIEQPRFRLIALPLRVKASGSPVRAIAVIDDSS